MTERSGTTGTLKRGRGNWEKLCFISSPLHETNNFTYFSFNAMSKPKKKNFQHYVTDFQPEIDNGRQNQTVNRDIGMAFDIHKLSRF